MVPVIMRICRGTKNGLICWCQEFKHMQSSGAFRMTEREEYILNDLIAVCAVARKCCIDAAEQAEHRKAIETFRDMAETRQEIIASLKSQIIARGGKITPRGEYAEVMWEAADDLAIGMPERDETLVMVLDEINNRAQIFFRQAVTKSWSQEHVILLEHQLRQLGDDHERMQTLRYYLERIS
ncbi:MAG: DUF2383 domain-containing protein [Alphaproteobacteria bacterium]|nr:MAG: DUF2383 domain-containing protein [Alphaproteobacteria bacterium]